MSENTAILEPSLIWEKIRTTADGMNTMKSLLYQVIQAVAELHSLGTTYRSEFSNIYHLFIAQCQHRWKQHTRIHTYTHSHTQTHTHAHIHTLTPSLLISMLLRLLCPGIVHRDIKPSNILVNADSINKEVTVLLADFSSGVSKECFESKLYGEKTADSIHLEEGASYEFQPSQAEESLQYGRFADFISYVHILLLS